MKRAFITLILLFSGTAFGESEAILVNEEITDDNLATIQLYVEDVGDPVYESLSLSVDVICKDRRLNGRSAKPKKIRVSSVPEMVCAFGDHAYDARGGRLTLNYATAELVVGDAPCIDRPAQTINIKKLCAKWNR